MERLKKGKTVQIYRRATNENPEGWIYADVVSTHKHQVRFVLEYGYTVCYRYFDIERMMRLGEIRW